MPPKPTPQQLEALHRLFQSRYWHQRWEVFPGVFTPGRNPVRELCELIQLPDDLSGARVLDVGAWNGCFSFECERRGAAGVVALGPEPAQDLVIDELGAILGSTKVRYVQGNCYSLVPEDLGTFDVILFLGVLYHLRYPQLAIDQIRRVARGKVFVETFVIDDGLPKPGGGVAPLSSELRNLSLWQFYRHDELGKDTSNWFGPNVHGVIAAFGSAGFDLKHLRSWHSRASFSGVVAGDVPEYQRLNCYEAHFPKPGYGTS
jgi:tRNA (mo5U34)-methyltransferase